MRRLTFKGYLESYVQQLAGQRTLALPRLAALARSEPRLTEPLVLWAVVTGHAPRLSKLLRAQGDLEHELVLLDSFEREGRLETALAAEDPRLRQEYAKLWRSYVVRRDAHARDAQLKLEVRSQVLELEKTKGVSRYRMAKDLGLNPGNLHAFLAQGNATKLSLDRALDLVRYMKAA